MQKTITIVSVQHNTRKSIVNDDEEYYFILDIVDSSLVGHPEEKYNIKHHNIKIVITYELRYNWGIRDITENDLSKILFYYMRNFVEQKIKEDNLQRNEVFYLNTDEHKEPTCPLEISRIPDPVDFVFQVSVKENLELDDFETIKVHSNIKVLITRMEDALKRDDYAGVLHSSASIFETMAKDIVSIPSVQHQTLKGFFDRYKNTSNLPSEILDYVLAIYNSRNTTPLAGHGSILEPNLSKDVAITLCEMTKAIVIIEYKLHK